MLYGSDPFYSWFGLNNTLIYAAHKTAGGMTSLYRQIGTGCEQLFRRLIRDQFKLTAAQAAWSYIIKVPGSKGRKLSLDGRISLEDLRSDEDRQCVQSWMASASAKMGIDPAISRALKGAVFEVRQGYKSTDSKRQNADIGNAGTAYAQGYLPVVVILSTQIDSDVADRYVNAGWLLLQGYLSDAPLASTYAFCGQVLGFDLAGFFQRYSDQLKQTVREVVETLLTASDEPQTVSAAAIPLDMALTDELEAAEELESDDEDIDED